jgi:hypothetical protein
MLRGQIGSCRERKLSTGEWREDGPLQMTRHEGGAITVEIDRVVQWLMKPCFHG